MKIYEERLARISARPATWLVTGAAGFIGSHLVEHLLQNGQAVVGLDNFSTGKKENLLLVQKSLPENLWKKFRFIEGDIRDLPTCREACRSVERVLHQAALGSVPRSIEDPVASHESNVNGFVNMLVAARDAGVARMVYASSSAVYGDHPALPKLEEVTGRAVSPYGLTKQLNELYAGVFASCYGVDTIGLRYFNVFGPRQDPNGAYAAVIPAFIRALLLQKTAYINGDGSAARDFCYVDNVVQANLLAARVVEPAALNLAYNIAYGEQTTLLELFELLKGIVGRRVPSARIARPVHRAPRRGDRKYSLADIARAQTLLGYSPRDRVPQGLEKTVEWYATHLQSVEEPAHA
jgi:UDP-N-acetylglucosamine 4-epimerase